MLEFALARKQDGTTAKSAPQATTKPSDVVPDGTKEEIKSPPVAPVTSTVEPAQVVAPPPSSLQQKLAAEEPVPVVPSAAALYQVYTKEILLRYVQIL